MIATLPDITEEACSQRGKVLVSRATQIDQRYVNTARAPRCASGPFSLVPDRRYRPVSPHAGSLTPWPSVDEEYWETSPAEKANQIHAYVPSSDGKR